MEFRVLTESVEYLDDVSSICFDYESKDVLDFSEYVQSARRQIKDLLYFSGDYRDTMQVTLSIYIDGEKRAVEYFRRSETEKTTITNWKLIYPLP